MTPGDALPLGATVRLDGVNFSLFSKHAEAVELVLFDRYDGPPVQVILLDPEHHRTFNYWHVLVEGVGEGLIYGYRVCGPFDPQRGHRYDPAKLLLDPYARGIVYGDNWSRRQACRRGANTYAAMKGLVVDPDTFDWEGVEPPRVPPEDRVIYEMHVRGFTRHPSSEVAEPGTFAGLVERIPYLLDLGVTTVQLMPVFQFDEKETTRVDPLTGRRLTNFWGYSPLGFFAPHRGYYIEGWTGMRYLTGFRDMVKALHRAGLEVYLDVVFNHTAEGGRGGPTLSFRGIDNAVYYLLDSEDRSRYLDFSGCGNTLNSNHPIVRRLILDSLRYWVEKMHVDGFRFDLASVLSRDEQGRPMKHPPLTWEIESDPALLRTRLIAEAWDAAGLYQVGTFPGERWGEWNGRFRDELRQFVRGDHGMVGKVAARLTGSADMYERHGREPHQSLNFVTCHDGFTLADLVSYERKHNLANGEDNRDGTSDNCSDNYGVEGPTDDPEIVALRRRQQKNLVALLLLAHGTPMLLSGDEIGRTQRGNNNAYCQDNAIGWVDWGLAETNQWLLRFVKHMIALRKACPCLRPRKYALGSASKARSRVKVTWHGVELEQPDWGGGSRTLAYTLELAGETTLHVLVNMHVDPLSFEVPSGHLWRRVVDTSLGAPDDITLLAEGKPHRWHTYRVAGRSVVVLGA